MSSSNRFLHVTTTALLVFTAAAHTAAQTPQAIGDALLDDLATADEAFALTLNTYSAVLDQISAVTFDDAQATETLTLYQTVMASAFGEVYSSNTSGLLTTPALLPAVSSALLNTSIFSEIALWPADANVFWDATAWGPLPASGFEPFVYVGRLNGAREVIGYMMVGHLGDLGFVRCTTEPGCEWTTFVPMAFTSAEGPLTGAELGTVLRGTVNGTWTPGSLWTWVDAVVVPQQLGSSDRGAPEIRPVDQGTWLSGPDFTACGADVAAAHLTAIAAIAANYSAATAPLVALQSAAAAAIGEGAASGFASSAAGHENPISAGIAGSIGGLAGGLSAAAAFNNANSAAIANATAAADAAAAQAQSDRCDALRDALDDLIECAEEHCSQIVEHIEEGKVEALANAGCS